MARPEQRKARKDYPREGIKAGDTYWYVKLKMQRGGRVMRSLTPFKPSQLTQSAAHLRHQKNSDAWLANRAGWDFMNAFLAVKQIDEEATKGESLA